MPGCALPACIPKLSNYVFYTDVADDHPCTEIAAVDYTIIYTSLYCSGLVPHLLYSSCRP